MKTHVSRILPKPGLRDRVQAVVLGYETGLVRPRRSDPYPGEPVIYAPEQVPGAFIPSSDSDG